MEHPRVSPETFSTKMFTKGKKDLLEFGIINIDKPAGCTSFDVVDFVRKELGLRKTGHFGTLDPMVTGVLPIALNRACKLVSFFIQHDKEYVGEMTIHEDIELDKIKAMIKKKFLGKIIQLPPVKSRVKRQEREREIKRFEILGKKGRIIEFVAEVQGGTYIRKLVHDLGEALGIGAHMSKLRRTRAGIFHEKDSMKLEELKDNLDRIQPADELIQKVLKSIQVKKDVVEKLFTGKPIHYEDLVAHQARIPKKGTRTSHEAPKDFEKRSLQGAKHFETGEIVCIFVEKRFIGVYEVKNEERVFAKSKFVMSEVRG
jgi:predicted rRNA pseudouridine synthase